MRSFVKALYITLGITGLLVALLLAAGRWRPVELSALIWPVVEAFAIEDYVGVTLNGTLQPDLFPIRETGISTEPVRVAVLAFLALLNAEELDRVRFSVTHDEWRRWANIHISTRQGLSLGEMNEAQQTALWAVLAEGLSASGYGQARDIVRLEEHLAELMNDWYQYGERRYWITVMGEPSATEPWGWQFEGHHLIINFFVLGDQVVMTPTFMGSEPVHAASGKYQGTRVFKAEEELSLSLMRNLSDQQQARAQIEALKPGNNNYGELFQDNAIVPRQGLSFRELPPMLRPLAEQLVRVYVGRLRDGHAEQWMNDVRAHWDDTYFAWVGPFDEDAVFYYRIQSPVLMIEFDHQSPVALEGPDAPTRDHVHTVIRTPNGNDYGFDLLRQHLERHSHD